MPMGRRAPGLVPERRRPFALRRPAWRADEDRRVSDARPWIRLYPPGVDPDPPAPRRTALDLFEAAARARPARPAIHYCDATLSYGELDAMAGALAGALADRGVRPGDRVALYLQNIPQFPIAQYGAWKAGAIVVPLNPMFKAAELAHHLDDCGATVLVALDSLYASTARHVAPRTAVRTVITTSEREFLPAGAGLPPPLPRTERLRFPETLDFRDLLRTTPLTPGAGARPRPEDIAYLSYTSGTTGAPKGAMNSHANVVSSAENYRAWMALRPGDVILGVAPLFHITGMVAHLGAAAAAGIPVVLFYRFDAGEALRLIERWRATFTVGALTVFIALADHGDVRRRDLGSFRKVCSGGAPVSPAVVERFRALTGAYIHNVYGLTETTSPTHIVPPGREAPVDAATGTLSVGVPLPGVEARVLDLDTGAPLPPGALGEIAIRGPMVVGGYWRKPEETAHAISDGWLRTGDVGRMDEEGWFYILDRRKDTIIASGYKVWPREVADVLLQHPGVGEAPVVGVPDPYRGETVKAFVALRQGTGNVTEGELIAFCRERLAAYKVPRAVTFVPEIPKTATGKTLRRLLRDRSSV